MDIPTTAASIMAAAQDQRLDFITIKNEANASGTNEEKEDETFWSHHQTQQPGKDDHPRDHCREERQREASNCTTFADISSLSSIMWWSFDGEP